MHRKTLNQAQLRFLLEPRGPILIKSGHQTPDPTRPSMEFVRTRHAELGETIYLPGTSLKGALRSHAERVFRGLDMEICQPFDDKSDCRNVEASTGDTASIYRNQCPICRTFGSLKVAGRLNISDAYPWDPRAEAAEQEASMRLANQTEQRFQVGIDRKLGQAQDSSLFDLELAVDGAFYGEIQLINFQLWQLGLILAVLREVDAGLVPIGFGKSRGLGQMSVEVLGIDIQSNHRTTERLLGIGELVEEQERQAYGLMFQDSVSLDSLAMPPLRRSWRGSRLACVDELTPLIDRILTETLEPFVDQGRQQGLGGTR